VYAIETRATSAGSIPAEDGYKRREMLEDMGKSIKKENQQKQNISNRDQSLLPAAG
jgi:hypothetical protein